MAVSQYQIEAMQHFIARGYSPVQAAAMVGGLVQESGPDLNPTIVGDAGASIGGAQWQGDRRRALESRPNWNTRPGQWDFVDWELKNRETSAYNRLMQAKTIDEAAEAFIGYERPRGWSVDNPRAGHGFQNRLRNAYALMGRDYEPMIAGGGDTDTMMGGPADDSVLVKPYGAEAGGDQSFIEQLLTTLGSGGLSAPQAALNYANPQEQQPLQTPEPDEGGILDELEKQLRQGAASVTDIATSLPWKGAAMLTAPGEYLGRKLGEVTNPGVDQDQIFSITDWLMEQGAKGDELSEQLAGLTGGPETYGQSTARAGAANVLMGGSKLAATELISLIGTYGPDVGGWLAEQFTGAPATAQPVDEMGVPIPEPPGVDKAAWEVLGPLAALTGVMAIAPGMTRFITSKAGRNRPRIKDIPEGPADAVSITKPRDVYRTMIDDSWAGVNNILGRMGLPISALKKAEAAMKIETRAAASAIAESALKNGKAQTLNSFFSVNTPLAQLKRVETPALNEYFHMGSLLDDFRLTGNPRIQGMTRRDVQRKVADYERQDPNARAIKTELRANYEEYLRFISTGRYRTISRAEATRRLTSRPNYVPGAGKSIDRPVQFNSAMDGFAEEIANGIINKLHNEAKATIIGASRQAADARLGTGVFREVTKAQIAQNKHWTEGKDGNHITKYKEAGKTHYVYSDGFLADVMKIDPFYFTGGAFAESVYGIKRAFEMFATGVGAPPFAVTAFIRNWQIGKMTTPQRTTAGVKLGSAGLARSLYAIPQQLLPQIARGLSEAFEASLFRNHPGVLGRIFTQPQRQAIAAMMGNAWHNSWLYHMEMMGPHAGTFLQQQARAANGRIATIADSVLDPRQNMFLKGLTQTLYAIHGAPAFAFSVKNLPRVGRAEMPEVLAIGRELTGDPRTGGQARLPTGELIRGNAPGKAIVGGAADIARTALPWANNIMQGVKAMSKAYWENPVQFLGRMWLYAIAPTIGIYLWNRAGGAEYEDHANNRRSQWQTQTNHYIRIPGRPPAEGEEFPVPQELTIIKRLTEVFLHHSFGNPSGRAEHELVFGLPEELETAALSFLGVTLVPPTSTLENIMLTMRGIQAPQTLTDEAFPRPEGMPFDQLGAPMEVSLMGQKIDFEPLLRTIGGAVGNAFVDGITAMAQTEEGYMKGVGNMVSEFGKSMTRRTPILRSLTGTVSPMSRDTTIRNELAAKEGALRDLDNHFKAVGKWWMEEGVEPQIVTKPRSDEGGDALDAWLEEVQGNADIGRFNADDSIAYPGMPQPPPTNPVYVEMMRYLVDNLQNDATGPDIMGFQSLLERRGNMTTMLKSIRDVNEGNFISWPIRLQNDPELRELVQGLPEEDRQTPTKVGNLITRELNIVEQELLMTIREVEKQMSDQYGQPITLESIDPYVTPGGLEPYGPPEGYNAQGIPSP